MRPLSSLCARRQGLVTHQFVDGYAARGMGAYNELIQREERRVGVDLLKHQAWSGAELMDQQVGRGGGRGVWREEGARGRAGLSRHHTSPVPLPHHRPFSP